MPKELAFHVQCSSLTPAGVVRSSLRRAAVGEGAEAHDLQPGEVFGGCRRGRRRWGARSAVRRRGGVFLGACRRGQRRRGLQLYQLRAAWGATVQLSGIWLGLWVSASGGAAQSASMFIYPEPNAKRKIHFPDLRTHNTPSSSNAQDQGAQSAKRRAPIRQKTLATPPQRGPAPVLQRVAYSK